jgi:hypothetical protein
MESLIVDEPVAVRQVDDDFDPLTEFLSGITNKETRNRYYGRLVLFFDYLKIDGGSPKRKAQVFCARAKKDPLWASQAVKQYAEFQKARVERKEISASTLPNFFKPIKRFCEDNDITLNWKKIQRRIPKGNKYADDRAYTIDEIKKLLSFPDRRIKPAVLTMVSSGCRVGAFESLNWGHIEPIKNKEGKLLGAKMKVYAGDGEQYATFITPECYGAWEEYIRFRSEHGEKISDKSPALRNLFYPDRSAPMRATARDPVRFHSDSVRHLIEDALFASGLRQALDKTKGERRHDVQMDHGFRKFFETACIEQAKIDALHVDFLEGHNTGLRENYHRGTDDQLFFEHYLKAIPFLTILEKSPEIIVEGAEDLKAEMEKMKEDQARTNKMILASVERLEQALAEARRDDRPKRRK